MKYVFVAVLLLLAAGLATWIAFDETSALAIDPVGVSGQDADVANTPLGGVDPQVGPAVVSKAPTTTRENIVQSVAPGQVLVRGRLVDSSGEPVTGQLIRIHPYPRTVAVPVAPGSAAESSRSPPPPLDAVTDPVGGFSVAWPAQHGGSLALAKSAFVFQAAPPFFYAPAPLGNAGQPAEVDLGEIALGTGAVVAGRVTTPESQPIAGAKIHLFAYDSHHPTNWQGQTDAQGRFEVAGVQSGVVQLSASVGGRFTASRTLQLVPGPQPEELVIQLPTGLEVRGIVHDHLGKPLAKARINVQNGYSDAGWSYQPANPVVTDDSGRFRIEVGKDGGYLRAMCRDHEEKHKQAKPGDVVEFVLPALGSVVGRVAGIDAAWLGRGQALVHHSDPGSRSSQVHGSGSTRAGGRFGSVADLEWAHFVDPTGSIERIEAQDSGDVYFNGLPHGSPFYGFGGARSKSFDIEADGAFACTGLQLRKVWLELVGCHRRVVVGPLDVNPGRSTDLGTIQVVPVGVVVVTVTDPDGKPIENATARLRPPQKDGASKRNGSEDLQLVIHDASTVNYATHWAPSRSICTAQTDAKGQCELFGALAGNYEVHCGHADRVASTPVAVQVPAAGTVAVAVRLESAGQIEVRAKNANGQPAARAALQLWSKGKEFKTGIGSITDSTGRLRFGRVAAGDYNLAFMVRTEWQLSSSNASGVVDGVATKLKVEPGRTTTIELTRPPQASLSGLVLKAGSGVANAEMILVPNSETNRHGDWNRARRVRTASDGAYRIEDLQPGTYDLWACELKARLGHHESVRIPGRQATEQNVILQYGRVEVSVVAADGPVTSVRIGLQLAAPGHVYFSNGAGRHCQARTDERGVAVFEGVPAGTYLVKAQDRSILAKGDTVQVTGGSHSVEMVVQRAAKLELVVRRGGKPWTQYVMVQMKRPGSENPTKITNTWWWPHRPVLQGLVPGDYEVSVRVYENGKTGPSQGPFKVKLEAGNTGKLEVDLPDSR